MEIMKIAYWVGSGVRRLLPFYLFTFLPLSLMAQDDDKTTMFNPVEHAVISQTIAPDARGAGMGDVGVATDPDVNSQYWNPAKYPFCISRSGIALNYTPWLRQLVNDIDLAYVAGYYRIGDYSAISGSLRYFSLGEVFADDGMSVKPYEMSIDLAYSLMLSEKFSLAAAIRWLYSDLRYDYSEDSKPASAFAADLAMYYNNYVMLGSRECQLGIGTPSLSTMIAFTFFTISSLVMIWLFRFIISTFYYKSDYKDTNYFDSSKTGSFWLSFNQIRMALMPFRR